MSITPALCWNYEVDRKMIKLGVVDMPTVEPKKRGRPKKIVASIENVNVETTSEEKPKAKKTAAKKGGDDEDVEPLDLWWHEHPRCFELIEAADAGDDSALAEIADLVKTHRNMAHVKITRSSGIKLDGVVVGSSYGFYWKSGSEDYDYYVAGLAEGLSNIRVGKSKKRAANHSGAIKKRNNKQKE